MRDSLESYPPESDQAAERPAQVERASLERRIQDATPVSDRPDRTTLVEAHRIDTGDIRSAADFDSHHPYASYRREAEMLKQMQPAIEQGADVETFHQWDEANQIGHYSPHQYVRGYADVYDTYYGNDAIAVEPKGDGTYSVLDGRHRAVAARDAGLRRIPVRIVG